MRFFVLFTFLVMSLANGYKHRDPDGTKLGSQDAMTPESISWEADAQKLLNEINAALDNPGNYEFSSKTSVWITRELMNSRPKQVASRY